MILQLGQGSAQYTGKGERGGAEEVEGRKEAYLDTYRCRQYIIESE